MFTLENNLNRYSLDNSQIELLNSIWKLNKKLIPNAQNAISINFPHYSLHDSSHSETIIKNIESFLGEDRIKQLSPTDTWLLLMSAYTHDLGMVVFYNTLERNWHEKEFIAYLRDVSLLSFDKDLQESASLLLDISNEKKQNEHYNLNLPLKIRKAVSLVIADFYRKTHHSRSRDILLGNDKEFYDLINGFNLTGIPNRFATVLADIAFAHGINFYQVIDSLEYISDGLSSDKMHPRFIACLLRLGDLLDVDDKRFNLFQSRVIDNDLPEISRSHFEKHSSIKHLLISPKSIEITADCNDDRVYRVARDWFDWLQKEVEDQSKEWSYIAPDELLGVAPTISRGKLKVLYQGSDSKKDFMNLRFNISNERIFEMFEGSAIYQNAEFVFFRELIQNALDASKIEVWKLIQSGVYDFLIKSHLKITDAITHDELLGKILFPGDLPSVIWDNFKINLDINWLNDDKELLIIKVRDNGTGISDSDLIRMTSKVGQSRTKDKKFQDIKQKMPYWLKPTGAFGIGLQSLFLITSKFVVQTKTDSELSKEIIFHSAKNGEYCKVTSTKPIMSRGTEISFVISRANFSELFPQGFNTSTVEQFDIFSDKYGEVYFYKIIEYLLREFSQINILNISITNENIKLNNSDVKREFLEKIYKSKKIRNANLQVTLYNENLIFDKFSFYVDENISIGSEFQIEFNNILSGNERSYPNFHHYESQYLVRDIIIKVDFPKYYKLSYCYIKWNLQSPESDKILTISRDKFIEKKQVEIGDSFLNNIFPKVLENMITLFESNHGDYREIKAIQYFHLELTAKMSKVAINSLPIIYGDAILPDKICTKLDKSPVKLIDFITAKKIMAIFRHKSLLHDNTESIKDFYSNLPIEEVFDSELIIWDSSYFDSYIQLSNFFLREYKIYETPQFLYSIMIFEKDLPLNRPVQTNELSEKEILRDLIYNSIDGKRRPSMYPINKYYKYLSVSDKFDNFSPNFRFKPVSHYIISPFKNKTEYDKLKKLSTNPDGTLLERDELRSFVKEFHLNNLIPEKLINFIVHKSPHLDNINPIGILNQYLDLIVDMLAIEVSD